MNWIKENRFIAVLSGITLLLGGLLVFIALSKGNAYEEQKKIFDESRDQCNQLVAGKLYPNRHTKEEKEKKIQLYKDLTKRLINYLDKYSLPQEKVSPQEFTAQRTRLVQELRELFSSEGTVIPDNCQFGFSKYATSDPFPGACSSTLLAELQAIECLLKSLVKYHPDTIFSITRIELPVEKSPTLIEEKKPSRKTRMRKKDKKEEESLFIKMPIELSFSMEEGDLRGFLKELASMEKYFYTVDFLRVRNEKQTPPSPEDATELVEENKSEGETSSNTGDSDLSPQPTERFQKKELPSSQRKLQQVLGSEKLHIALKIDVLFLIKPALFSKEKEVKKH